MSNKNNSLKKSILCSLFFIFGLTVFLNANTWIDYPKCIKPAEDFIDPRTGEIVSRNPIVPCCSGGVGSCCNIGYRNSEDGQMYLIYPYVMPEMCDEFDSGVIDPNQPRVDNCNPGLVQYRAEGDCDTLTRTCCGTVKGINTRWSDWGTDCHGCADYQCWNGSECENQGGTQMFCSYMKGGNSGVLTRSATCGSSGWQYGNWQGSCTCQQGYSWNSNTKTCGPSSSSVVGGGGTFNPEQPIQPIGS